MNKNEKYPGTMPSVKKFIHDYKVNWWIIGIFLCAAYGIKVSHISISHDTEAVISVSEALYESWYTMGRFGLIFLKKILGTYVFNPYTASFFMIVMMMFNSMLWTYLFCWLGNAQRKMVSVSWIFPAFFFTSMIMAEQNGFLLQAYEVNAAILMVGFALICLFKSFLETRKLRWCIPAVFCCVIAFSVYQTLVPLFTAGAALCFVVLYDRMVQEQKTQISVKFCFILIGKLIAVFLFSFLVYQIVNKIILSLLGMETTSYITEQIMWGQLPAKECIRNILGHVYHAVFGTGLFYNGVNLVIYIWAAGYIISRIRKKEPCYILYVLAFLYCMASPFFMTILMGNEPTVRTQLLLPFVMGFFLQYLTGKISRSESKTMWYVKGIAIVAVGAVTMNQSLLTARLYYTQYMQYEEDVQLAGKITDRIEQLGLGEVPEEPVIFVGSRTPQKNPSCIESDQLELIGKSFFEVSFGTNHGTWVMHNFLVTQGHPYVLPTSEQVQLADSVAEDMPSWPDKGCVIEKDGVIVVKLK